MNLIDHIGNKVTVWTAEGNSMTERTLITADEMGIVVSPHLADVTSLPLQKEVFIPWNRVKYVDLLKPRDIASESDAPKPLLNIYGGPPRAVPTPLDPIENAPVSFDRAEVGDVVRYLGHGSLLEIKATVKEVKEDGVVVASDVFGGFIEHGYYTIVKRSDDGGRDTTPEQISEPADDWGGRQPLPTSKLVEMLAKREGVEEIIVHPEHAFTFYRRQGDKEERTRSIYGPARVLVVID